MSKSATESDRRTIRITLSEKESVCLRVLAALHDVSPSMCASSLIRGKLAEEQHKPIERFVEKSTDVTA